MWLFYTHPGLFMTKKETDKLDATRWTAPLTPAQRKAARRLDLALDAILAKAHELQATPSDDPGYNEAVLAAGVLTSLHNTVTEAIILGQENTQDKQALETMRNSIQAAVDEAKSKDEIQYKPGLKDLIYNVMIMTAAFLAAVIPGMIYVGMGAESYSRTKRFWLFEFGPTAYLTKNAQELADAANAFPDADADEVKEERRFFPLA